MLPHSLVILCANFRSVSLWLGSDFMESVATPFYCSCVCSLCWTHRGSQVARTDGGRARSWAPALEPLLLLLVPVAHRAGRLSLLSARAALLVHQAPALGGCRSRVEQSPVPVPSAGSSLALSAAFFSCRAVRHRAELRRCARLLLSVRSVRDRPGAPSAPLFLLPVSVFVFWLGLVRLVEKPAGFGWFNSILWERISWNKLKQAETWPAEQGLWSGLISRCGPSKKARFHK
jgi:hypothetical protein